jgi:cytochrome c biogenesis protein
VQPVVDRWYGWDVYGSAPFAILLAVLSIAIAVCTINRVPGIWQTISHPAIRTSAGYLARASAAATLRSPIDAAALEGQVRDTLGARRYRLLTERVGVDVHLYADKNRFTRLATFPFHLALILLLVGGIVTSTYGFRERELTVAEGSSRSVGHGTGLTVQLNRFEDTYTPIGVADQFTSNVTIFKDGEPVKTGDISVNDPLSYGNATFYQTDFGTSAEMLVQDRAGNVLFSGPVDLGLFTYTSNSDAPAGFVDIPAAGVVLTVVGPDMDPAGAPELDTLQLRSGQMWVQMQPIGGAPPSTAGMPPTAVIDQGASTAMGDLTVSFVRETRHSLFQVAYNPGIPIFLIASVLLVGGLVITFYWPRRRLRGIIGPQGAGAVLTLVPLARRDWSARQDFFKVVEALAASLGVTPEIQRDSAPADGAAAPDRPAAIAGDG